MYINNINISNTSDWIDIRDLGMGLVTKSVPETPNIEVSESDSISNRKILQNTSYTHRDIEVELSLLANSKEDVRTKLTELTRIISGEFNLRFKDNNSQIYKQVHLNSAIDIDKITNESYIVKLKFRSYDPFRYSNENIIQVLPKITGIVTHSIVNNGNYEAYPVIKLTGSTPLINIRVGQNVIQYLNLVNSETVYIDCKNFTVTKEIAGDTTNALVNWRKGFISLKPGNNDISFSGESLNVNVEIEFRHTFL